jgi:hypothetical protein
VSASIATLPVWKKGSTAAEWLEELAAMAREHPERWARIVVVLEELNSDGLAYKTRNYSRNIPTNSDILGVLETAQLDIWETMKGRN